MMIALTKRQKQKKLFKEMANRADACQMKLELTKRLKLLDNDADTTACANALNALCKTLREQADQYVEFQNPSQKEVFKAMEALMSRIEDYTTKGLLHAAECGADVLKEFIKKCFILKETVDFEDVHRALNFLDMIAEKDRLSSEVDRMYMTISPLEDHLCKVKKRRAQCETESEVKSCENELAWINEKLRMLYDHVNAVQEELSRLHDGIHMMKELDKALKLLDWVGNVSQSVELLRKLEELQLRFEALRQTIKDDAGDTE
jgi:hypothetical protein